MADIIIVLIVVVLLGLALKGSVKHFKGEGACCGGGGGSISVDIPQKIPTYDFLRIKKDWFMILQSFHNICY